MARVVAPIIPALGRLRQGNFHMLLGSLGYTVRFRLDWVIMRFFIKKK